MTDTAATDASYVHKSGEYFDQQRQEMLAYVPSAAAKLLEVGCGNAAFAACLKRLRPVHVTAIEAHAGAADVAASRVDRLLRSSIEEALPQLLAEGQGHFDCIVLNDVLEHLIDPWSVLSQLHALLAPTGSVVVSLPNVRYLPVFKDLVLRGQWRYQLDGVLDRTHLRFFTRQSMVDLLHSTGYRVECIEGIHPIQVSWKFKLLDMLAGGRLADTQFRQLACVARRAGAGA